VSIAWWCVAGGLTVISAGLFRHQVAMLSAANPAARLPWIGWPANKPRRAKVLGFFAAMSSYAALNCVVRGALGGRHLYDLLWALPLLLIVTVVMAVPQVQHNRRVRSASSS
jgi:hypothetical protein